MLIYTQNRREFKFSNCSRGFMSEDLNQDEEDVTDKSNRDEMIRKKNFSRARGIDVSSFMISTEEEKTSELEMLDVEVPKDVDIAMGEVAELFSKGGEEYKLAGAIQKDGTVNTPP